jgi:hypothetical protein
MLHASRSARLNLDQCGDRQNGQQEYEMPTDYEGDAMREPLALNDVADAKRRRAVAGARPIG